MLKKIIFIISLFFITNFIYSITENELMDSIFKDEISDYDTPEFKASRWYYNALYHYENLQIVKTIECLKKALEADPNFKDAQNMLDTILKVDKNPSSMDKIIRQEADAYFKLAIAADAKGNYQESKKFYEKVIELDKEYYEAYLALSVVYKKLNLVNNLISELEQYILEKGENDLEARLRLAFYYRIIEKNDEALEQFYKVKSLSPYSDKLYYYLGLLLIKVDKFFEAVEEISTAVAIKPNEDKYKKLLVLAKRLEKAPPKVIERQTLISIQSKVNRLECVKNRELIKKAFEKYNNLEAFPMTELNLAILKNNNYLKEIPICKDHGNYSVTFLPDNQIKINCSYHDQFENEEIDIFNIDEQEISTNKDPSSIDDLYNIDLDDKIEIDLD